MDIKEIIFGTVGGLAIFLFGMTYMAESLEKIGSNSLKKLLHALTKNRLNAILIGAGVTCIIQSSSATSVIVVGFVNAGLLQLEQAIAVVLGADIGTTITAWIVSTMGIGRLEITAYSLPVIAVGFVIYFVSKSTKKKMIGQTILGFGLLFLGLGIMSDGVKSIKGSPVVMAFFVKFSSSPPMELLIGIIFTCIIQSSSATIAIVQVMAFQGIFGLETALPLVLGANIGTTITAQLAVTGGTRAARAVANANTLFKVFAVLIFIPLLFSGWYQAGVLAIVPDKIVEETARNSRIMLQIAVAHSVFMLINVPLFSTLLWRFLIACAKKITFAGKPTGEPEEIRYLDPLLLKTPQIALEQCVRQIEYMTLQCQKNINAAFEAFMQMNLDEARTILKRESRIDNLQSEITAFLVELGSMGLTEEQSRLIPKLIHCVNDAERIGDHAKNLLELTQISVDNNYKFSAQAIEDLKKYFELVEKQFKAVISALQTRKSSAVADALVIEEQLNENCVIISKNHVDRLEKGHCNVRSGVVFLDVIANLEKIGDHLRNIAKRVELENAT